MAQQPTVERADPRTRRAAPGQSGQLKNGKPDKQYKLANPNDDIHGLQFHLDTGWEKLFVDPKDRNGERVVGGRVHPDGMISFGGQILIWLPKEEWEAREAEKKSVLMARESKRKAPGGIDSVRSADGTPAKQMADTPQ